MDALLRYSRILSIIFSNLCKRGFCKTLRTLQISTKEELRDVWDDLTIWESVECPQCELTAILP